MTCAWGWAAVHDCLDPEFSILKQRLARRMEHEGFDEDQVQALDLVQITKARSFPPKKAV